VQIITNSKRKYVVYSHATMLIMSSSLNGGNFTVIVT
jgi:hypothetical protein